MDELVNSLRNMKNEMVLEQFIQMIKESYSNSLPLSIDVFYRILYK